MSHIEAKAIDEDHRAVATIGGAGAVGRPSAVGHTACWSAALSRAHGRYIAAAALPPPPRCRASGRRRPSARASRGRTPPEVAYSRRSRQPPLGWLDVGHAGDLGECSRANASGENQIGPHVSRRSPCSCSSSSRRRSASRRASAPRASRSVAQSVSSFSLSWATRRGSSTRAPRAVLAEAGPGSPGSARETRRSDTRRAAHVPCGLAQLPRGGDLSLGVGIEAVVLPCTDGRTPLQPTIVEERRGTPAGRRASRGSRWHGSGLRSC